MRLGPSNLVYELAKKWVDEEEEGEVVEEGRLKMTKAVPHEAQFFVLGLEGDVREEVEEGGAEGEVVVQTE